MQFQALHLNTPTICAMLKHFLSPTHIFSSTSVSDKVRGNLFMSFLYVYFLFSLPPSSSSCLSQHIKHAPVYTALCQSILSLSLFTSCYAILQLPCFLFWYFHFLTKSHCMSAKVRELGNLIQCVFKDAVTDQYSLM